jgi:hypothetical protein
MKPFTESGGQVIGTLTIPTVRPRALKSCQIAGARRQVASTKRPRGSPAAGIQKLQMP